MSPTFRRLLKDRSGNFALMFGLLTIPIVSALGCAVDLSYALTAQRQLQQSADSAAVSALAEQSVGVIAALKNGTIGTVDVANTDAGAISRRISTPSSPPT